MLEPTIRYYVAIDPQAITKSTVGAQGISHVIWVAPSGVVRWEGRPFFEGAQPMLDAVQTVLKLYAI